MKRKNEHRAKRSVALWLVFFALVLSLAGCAKLILKKGFPQTEGAINGLPVRQDVEVFRDRYGIPHIYAQTEHDLMVAQGFVHAQDRLWQMETMRRLATGRLSELGGEEVLELDFWMRLLGLPTMRIELAGRIGEWESSLAMAYLKGINAFIDQNRDNLPLEFQKLKHVPEPWTIEDLFNVMVVNAWFLETNFPQELVALAGRKHLGLEELKVVLPSYPDVKLPEDAYFETLRELELGPFLSAVEGLYNASSTFEGVGSNNWVAADGPGGKPLLANDPHLALVVPGVWYFVQLTCPDYHAAGASMAGTPGIVIGHNEDVAWGWTNVMTDVADLYVFRTDPVNPYVYYVQDEPHLLVKQEMVFRLPDGSERIRHLYQTIHGPVITEVGGKYNAIAALKWYGTVPVEPIGDKSGLGMAMLNRAKNVQEGFEAGRHFKIVGQNLVIADRQGNIGWHAFGAAPIRKNYSGRLPADGSSGDMNWAGYYDYDRMPWLVNPESGWIATANQRSIGEESENTITHGWCAPYRHQRISQLLNEGKPATVERFSRMQMDVHSLQADRLLPKLQAYRFTDPRAKKIFDQMMAWDREVTAQSTGAAVFEVFITEWVRALLEDEFGENLRFYFHILPAAYLVHDVILDHPDSTVWDRVDTPEKETPQQILAQALIATQAWLSSRLGEDPEQWQWGRIHQYYWAHPGAKRSIEHKLLSRGPYPAPGDSGTINAACFDPSLGSYGAFVVPSFRMISPLENLESTTLIGPMGQSAQPGHPHYDDMIEPWINGQTVPLYFTRSQVEQNAVARLVLQP